MSMLLLIGIGFIVLSFLAPILGVIAGIVLPALVSVVALIGGLIFIGAVIGRATSKKDDDK